MAVTVYGPPTRIAGIRKRPSARVATWYVVPDGWCTATTRELATGPCALRTVPAIEPVVSPCAKSGDQGKASMSTATRAAGDVC